jgi:uncharacterized protein YggE
MKLLSAILSAVADCEAHPEFKIGFTVKDPAAVSELLLKNAIKDATRKAEVLAQASNVKLGMIQQIDYNWGELHLYSDIDMDIKMCADMSPMGGAIEIEPNDIDVSDSVTVVWAIE